MEVEADQVSESEEAMVAQAHEMTHAPDAPPQNARDVPPNERGHHDQQERRLATQLHPRLQTFATAAADNALAFATDTPHS